ncbi:MAG: 4Fe-4S binding protein [Chloroflexi bacterium]|nr:4Fe-4S binding protein [Chloroflexota bacterium]
MKLVNLIPSVDLDKCTGCSICTRVCPTLSIPVVDKKAAVDEATCFGCGNCEQRCPHFAIAMLKRPDPFYLQVESSDLPEETLVDLCRKARMHPEQIVCYCTATRAKEVAAAVMKGARSPEDISRVTGIRSGCKVECIQPMLRLLEAAGVKPKPPKGGYQWYGRTITIWELPEEVKRKHAARGFHFDEDRELMSRVADSSGQ